MKKLIILFTAILILQGCDLYYKDMAPEAEIDINHSNEKILERQKDVENVFSDIM